MEEIKKNSHEWYEQVYHDPKNMPRFEDYIKSAVDRGYHGRFLAMFDAFKKIVDANTVHEALEIGGHLGKTAHWLIENMRLVNLDIMDFSAPSIKYLKENLGMRARAIFQDSVDNIHIEDKDYDLITCIDVSEHLTGPVYFGMLKEIARLLKPEGHCIFYGSMAVHNTHINIRNPATIIKDSDGLLKFVKMLPHNHILFRGI